MRRIAIAMTAAILLAVAPAAVAKGAGGPLGLSAAPAESGIGGPDTDSNGDFRYSVLPPGSRDNSTLLGIETDGGEIATRNALPGNWALPAVTVESEPGGLSADGRTLVLVEPNYTIDARRTSFLAVDTARPRDTRRYHLPGQYAFDAISPDGEMMYLVEYLDPVNPLEYRVRAFDLTTGELQPGEIVDPEEPGERMAGQPVARQASPDGRWAYTLYGGGEEAFIHALDTEGETAVCVDLEEFTPGQAFRLDLAVAAGTGAISVMSRGEPAATVDPESFEVTRVTEEVVPGPQDDGGSGWLLAAALGAVAIAAIGLLAVRRRRRRTDEAGLGEIFVGAQAAEADEEREREPEPVP